MSITFYGVIATFLQPFIKVKPKHWVFGADYGKSYREGSKYLLEYMIKEHPEYDCTFLTLNKDVYYNLKKQGIPCEMNTSLKGILKALEADCVFYTQTITDIYFTRKRKDRTFYYLVHGQPLKIAQKALEKTEFYKKLQKDITTYQRIKNKICYFFNLYHDTKDVSFVSSTSEFLTPYMEKDFAYQIPVKVLGMPRNDALFDKNRMSQEKWLKGTENKLVITYMPTHRAYGKGKITPTPFINRPDIQKWMIENNILLLMKNHPNMISQQHKIINTECIKDITKSGIDPQVCIYHSDALITDFSSVWMDYLLLRRPIIFYIYDDFEHNDVGTHYDIRKDPPGSFCYSEDELFTLIKKIKNNYNSMIPDNRIIHKYHKYIDGKSCERYYNEIKLKYGRD